MFRTEDNSEDRLGIAPVSCRAVRKEVRCEQKTEVCVMDLLLFCRSNFFRRIKAKKIMLAFFDGSAFACSAFVF